jgi:hypothetical protein
MLDVVGSEFIKRAAVSFFGFYLLRLGCPGQGARLLPRVAGGVGHQSATGASCVSCVSCSSLWAMTRSWRRQTSWVLGPGVLIMRARETPGVVDEFRNRPPASPPRRLKTIHALSATHKASRNYPENTRASRDSLAVQPASIEIKGNPYHALRVLMCGPYREHSSLQQQQTLNMLVRASVQDISFRSPAARSAAPNPESQRAHSLASVSRV